MHDHFHDERRRHGRRGPGGRGGRARRGDVRVAVLHLLEEEPMHGYQLMDAIRERTGGRWAPSPGAIYPMIAQLADEGLVTVTADSGRKLVALTDQGRAEAETHRTNEGDPFAEAAGAGSARDLRPLLQGLHGAAREVARNGTDAQLEAAGTILQDARRALYRLLAADDDVGS
jgi:DNA-binding PadR family transcriptional regulator